MESTEIRRAIWLHVAKQEGRVSAAEIAEALTLRPSEFLTSMVQCGQLSRVIGDKGYSYGVTVTCRIPRGLTLKDVLTATGVPVQGKQEMPQGHGPDFRQYAPTPESLPWRMCMHFKAYPDALLNRREIAQMFGISKPDGLEGNITRAVVNGAIRKVIEPGKEMRWGKGPSEKVVLLDPPPAVIPETTEARANDPFNLAGQA